MTNTPATPLPWTADHDCISAQGQHISMAIGADGASYAEQKQNAAYIVRACNAYPQLVAELRNNAFFPTERGQRVIALLRSLGEE